MKNATINKTLKDIINYQWTEYFGDDNEDCLSIDCIKEDMAGFTSELENKGIIEWYLKTRDNDYEEWLEARTYGQFGKSDKVYGIVFNFDVGLSDTREEVIQDILDLNESYLQVVKDFKYDKKKGTK